MTLSTNPDLMYNVLRSRHSDFSVEELSAVLDAPEDITESLQALIDDNRAVSLPNGLYLSDVAATRLRDTARRAVAAFHKQNPLRRAIPRADLAAPLLKAAVFHDLDAVLSWLMGQGILAPEGDLGVRLPDHQVQIPVKWQEAADEIRAVYSAAGLNPPLPGNFQANYPRDVSVPGILTILVELEELIAIDDRTYVSAKAIDETKAVLRRLAATSEGITVGGVRNATGASRRILLPLLEYFDAQGITRRSGENRVLA